MSIPVPDSADPIKTARVAARIAERLLESVPTDDSNTDSTDSTISFGFNAERADTYRDTRNDWANEDTAAKERDTR